MSQVKYSYNPKTCRYEPAQVSIWGVSGYAVLFLITTSILFFGLLVLHSELFISEKAIAIRKENAALRQHHVSLQNELTVVEGVLASIKETEASLQKKLFDASNTETTSNDFSDADQNRILLADATGFSNALNHLKEKSSAIRSVSDEHNNHFRSMTVSTKDLVFLTRMPSILPLEFTDLTKLASGFGKRINPFHKGNYDHPGADFTAVRGTPVLATASGRVIKVVSNSSLQAGYGNYVEVNHGNNIITRYAHLEEVRVKLGQKVSKGSVIATVGSSGGSVAPHLHYEIIRSGEAVNPLPYMMEKLSGKEYAELQKAGSRKNQSLD
jgi:murein DD-endopeptidase MepM/ murein hydrolase activator NlpD